MSTFDALHLDFDSLEGVFAHFFGGRSQQGKAYLLSGRTAQQVHRVLQIHFIGGSSVDLENLIAR